MQVRTTATTPVHQLTTQANFNAMHSNGTEKACTYTHTHTWSRLTHVVSSPFSHMISHTSFKKYLSSKQQHCKNYLLYAVKMKFIQQCIHVRIKLRHYITMKRCNVKILQQWMNDFLINNFWTSLKDLSQQPIILLCSDSTSN